MISDNLPPIAALSTPPGKGGIAVIRVSGEGAVETASRLCSRDLREVDGGRIVHTRIRTLDGRPLDDGMAAVFRAPRSFTGEDTVELSCHGGTYVVSAVLGELLRAGCRPAGRGEFTRRAFLNGKLGLSAAEAIADVIDAENEGQLTLAVENAAGSLSGKLDSLYQSLKTLVSEMLVRIDYEDVDLPPEFVPDLRAVVAQLETLADGYAAGRAVRQGVPTVIAGAPNVGKSSLLNRILGEDRAIVTDIAGTTRDTLTEKVSYGGATLLLTDTAGLRESGDAVETLGVARTRDAVAGAGLVLAVYDLSRPLTPEESAVTELLKETAVPVVAVLNKCDGAADGGEHAASLPEKWPVVTLSAKTGEGMDALESAVAALLGTGAAAETLLIANARQYAAVTAALDVLREAEDAIAGGMPDDVVSVLLEEAMTCLGRCDGRDVSQDVVDEIFARFCVGK